MPVNWKHWCPNLCGKRCVAERQQLKHEYKYVCLVCNTKWTKTQIAEFKEKSTIQKVNKQ